MNANTTLMSCRCAVLAGVLVLAGCGGGSLEIQSEQLIGEDESMAQLTGELSSSVAIGTTLKATTNVNLRSGPSTGDKVLRVVANGSTVKTVERTTPSNGFYKVNHNGVVGWTHGAYYTVVSSGSGSGSSSVRDSAIARAKTGVGFSYWWGHGRWLSGGPSSSNKGYCSGSCPSCSHSGSYGADCSGYLAKVWQVGSGTSSVNTDSHPYSTYNFYSQSTAWHDVSRNSLKKADALVYRSGDAGHTFVYESGSGWGSMWALEAKGCSTGIVRNLRTASNAYKAIARNGW